VAYRWIEKNNPFKIGIKKSTKLFEKTGDIHLTLNDFLKKK
jgi:hypothetical protein